MTGEKVINSINELKSFYNKYFELLIYLSIIYVCPEIEKLDSKYRKLSFKYRLKTQKYVNNFGNIIDGFFKNNFKEYESIYKYMIPSEVFVLEKRKLTENEIKRIQDRKENGYFIFRSKVYEYKYLLKILSKYKLSIPDDYYKIKLHKEHSREYSLSRVYACNRMFIYYFKKIKVIGYPLKYNCLIYNGKNLVDSYYNQKELFTAFKYI